MAQNIFGHFLDQPNSLNLTPRALKFALLNHSQHYNSKVDLLAQNIFGHFSEQPNTFKLTRRALKFALKLDL